MAPEVGQGPTFREVMVGDDRETFTPFAASPDGRILASSYDDGNIRLWDTSGGQMTNLGHHSLDVVRWVLGADPLAVTSAGGRFSLQDNGETPDTQDAFFEMPAADGKSADFTYSYTLTQS